MPTFSALRSAPFRRYWLALTGSAAGDGVSSVALPLIAASMLDASPAQMGWLSALTWIPSALLAMPASGWVSRVRRPFTVMIIADLVCSVVLAALPVAATLDMLDLAALDAMTVVIATASVMFTVSDAAVFPVLLTRDSFVTGQSLIYGARMSALIFGAGAGSLLISLVSAPLTAAADAISYIWSAALLAGVARAQPAAPLPRVQSFSIDGLRFIAGAPALRIALGVTTTANFCTAIFHTLLVLFLTHILRLPASFTGVVLGAEAAGAFVGAAIAPPLAGRLGLRRGLRLGSLLTAAPLTFIAAAVGGRAVLLVVVSAAAFLSGVGRSLQDISVGAIFSSTVPERLRTQVRGAYQTVSFSARPIGAVLGGLTGAWLGLRAAICAAAVGGLFAFVWTLSSGDPRSGYRRLPRLRARPLQRPVMDADQLRL